MSTFNEVKNTDRLSTVKGGLESWREVVIRADSLLGWEQDWYPAVIGGVLTAAFLFIWYWDPTLLTLFAALGLSVTLLDYFGPKIINQVFGQNSWNGAKERKFDQVCEEIVTALDNIESSFSFLLEARKRKPVVHFVFTLVSLMVLAWLGNRIDNFFLAYLLTLALAMVPGLQRRGILNQHLAVFKSKISEAMGKGSAVTKDELKKAE